MAETALSLHFCLATATSLLRCVFKCDSAKPVAQSELTETLSEAEHHIWTESRMAES